MFNSYLEIRARVKIKDLSLILAFEFSKKRLIQILFYNLKALQST